MNILGVRHISPLRLQARIPKYQARNYGECICLSSAAILKDMVARWQIPKSQKANYDRQIGVEAPHFNTAVAGAILAQATLAQV